MAAVGFNEPFIGDSLPQPTEVNPLCAGAVRVRKRDRHGVPVGSDASSRKGPVGCGRPT